MMAILIILFIYVILNIFFVYFPLSNIEQDVDKTSNDVEFTLGNVNSLVELTCRTDFLKDLFCATNCLAVNRLCPGSPCKTPCKPT